MEKHRDKRMIILLFGVFFLSFYVLWNMVDLTIKINNQKKGSQTYKYTQDVVLYFNRIETLREEGMQEEAYEYSKDVMTNIISELQKLSDANLAFSSMFLPIQYKDDYAYAEIIIKKNEELPYDDAKIYDDLGQILIGESLKPYGSKDGKKMYIADIPFDINGELANYGVSGQDERVVILSEKLDSEKKKLLFDVIQHECYVGYMITISIGSNDQTKMNNTLTFLMDYINEMEDIDFNLVQKRQQPGEQNYWYQLYHSLFGSICIIFSLLCGLVVSHLWFSRRKREFMIRRIWGYSNKQLMGIVAREIGLVAIVALFCSTVGWILEQVVSHSEIYWNYIGKQVLLMFAGTVVVIATSVILPFCKILTINPAEGLQNYGR